MDETIRLVVFCNCREQTIIPRVKKIVPCKWTFLEDKICPEIQDQHQIFDWECDPRVSDCPIGQYDQLETDQNLKLRNKEWEKSENEKEKSEEEKSKDDYLELEEIDAQPDEKFISEKKKREKLKEDELSLKRDDYSELEKIAFESKLEIEYLKKDYNRSLSHLEKTLDSKYKIQYLEEMVESKMKLEFMEKQRNKTMKMMTTMLNNFNEI